VLINDIQSVIDVQEQQRQNSLSDGFFDDYHVYEEIMVYLQQLAQQHSSIVTYLPGLGSTIQGRSINGILIHGGPEQASVKPGDLSSIPDSVPKIWFQGGLHAREWIGPATVMYITEQLLTRYGTDTEVTELLNTVGFFVVPLINADGYSFSWTGNRLWRKNRRQNVGGTIGVDLNRNYDVNFGGQGSSRNPASDTYCGTAAFSEPETNALSKFISSQKNFIAGIDWHSYSQLILRPYGYTTTRPPNDEVVRLIGEEIRIAIRNTHNMAYTNQASWQLYATSGTASDWFFVRGGIPVSYTIELRDTGRFGFLLPANQIIPTGQESFAATLALASSLMATWQKALL